jgi:DUF438 domain-containing protein
VSELKYHTFDLIELYRHAIDRVPLAITLLSPDGEIVLYNEESAKILDRKPEYIGTNVRDCHRKVESIQTIDTMLEDFAGGKTEPYYYESDEPDRTLCVTIVPLRSNGELLGFLQTVTLKP